MKILHKSFIRILSRNKLHVTAVFAVITIGVAFYSSLMMAIFSLSQSYEYT